MDDKCIMENLLLTTKGVCDLYMHGTIESSSENVHQAFDKALNDSLCMQDDIYKKMSAKGWYQMEQAEQEKIQKVNLADPALGRLDGSHLDAGQGIVELLGDRSHGLHAAGEANLSAVVNDFANRGDHGRGSAQAALCEVVKLRQLHRALGYFDAQVVLRHVD